MLRPFVVIVAFQFLGEAIAWLAALPVPGPVIGLALLALGATLAAPLRREVEAVADLLLRHLSLLFVPAGVGVLQHLDLVRREALAIVAVLVVSTLVTLAVTALTFVALAGGPSRDSGEETR